MSRIQQISPEHATDKTAELFSAVKGKLGMVPNMMRALGNSPAALQSYLQFSGALASGSLTAKERELIALAVGQANDCNYCLAAHSALGKMAGLTSDQIRDARLGTASDEKSEALIQFARNLVVARGHVTDADLEGLKARGFGDEHVVEIVANVALNILTNYFNHVAETDVDFPAAEAIEPQAEACSSDKHCSVA